MVHSDRSNMAYPEERRITLRYPGSIYQEIQDLARQDHRSVNGEIVWLLLIALEWRLAFNRASQRFRDTGPEDMPERIESGLAPNRAYPLEELPEDQGS